MIKGINTPYPLQWAAGAVSAILPLFVKQRPGNIVLTSFHGDGFRGNTKTIFEALIGHPTLKPVWLSRNKKVVDHIRQAYGERFAEYCHSPTGLLALASASAVLFTHGTSDFPFLRIPRRAIRMQTYHGLPTKRGEFMRPKGDQPPNALHRCILNYRFRPITHFLSSSPEVTRIFSKRFGLPVETFIETGFPAYDRLIQAPKPERPITDILPGTPASQKTILYAPTYRRLAKTRWFPFGDFDPAGLASFLEKEKALLVLRPHPNETSNLKRLQKISDRIVLAGHKQLEDINLLMPYADAIVTDYSSIYIEGLLRDIPAVFIPYDLGSYERGLPLPYDEVTPGPKTHTQSAFMEALQDALHSPGNLRKERDRVKRIFFSKTDGHATKSVVELIEQLMSCQRKES